MRQLSIDRHLPIDIGLVVCKDLFRLRDVPYLWCVRACGHDQWRAMHTSVSSSSIAGLLRYCTGFRLKRTLVRQLSVRPLCLWELTMAATKSDDWHLSALVSGIFSPAYKVRPAAIYSIQCWANACEQLGRRMWTLEGSALGIATWRRPCSRPWSERRLELG